MFLKRKAADKVYLFLAGVFIASLVAGNLIFQKFFYWNLGFFKFELSVGILPYPITFLVTDIISEIYGRRKADMVVFSGLIASAFIMILTIVSDAAPATAWSPINDETYHKVFGLFGPAVFASMTAYLTAQFIDIRLFHFWMRVTEGRQLWLRNNASTVVSQFVDTFAVLFLLCSFEVIAWDKFGLLLVNGFLFKMLVALADTPLFYFFSWYLRRSFGLKLGEQYTVTTADLVVGS